MKIYRLLIGIIVLILLLASMAWWISQPALTKTSAREIWETHFLDRVGTQQKLSRPDERPVVVNFWATWCEPCREEMEDLSVLAEKWKGKIDFVGVAVDNPAAVEKFLEKRKMAYSIVVGQADVLALMQSEGNELGGLPFTVIYDKKGKQIMHISGKIVNDYLNEQLKKAVITQS